jgi:hypothetical protein
MTADDSARDDARRDSDGDAAEPDAQPQPPLDEEAAWRLIVENFGDRANLDSDAPATSPADPTSPAQSTSPADPTSPDAPATSPADPGSSADPAFSADPAADTADTDPEPPPTAPQRPGHDPFDRSYLDWLDESRTEPSPRQDRRRNDPPEPVEVARAQPADRDGEEHFVPPEPPPVPRATPSRRLAWCGLFLPPLLMLAAVVLDWTFPSWVALGLVAAFVGGFVFLVATMPRNGGDGWGDGAVV